MTWCELCDPFGEDTPLYLSHSEPTVRWDTGEDGNPRGLCLMCGRIYRYDYINYEV